MKKSSILWSVLGAVFLFLAIQVGFAFASLPLQVVPNWSTIVSALVGFLALVGLILRRAFSRGEVPAEKSRDAAGLVGAPVAELP